MDVEEVEAEEAVSPAPAPKAHSRVRLGVRETRATSLGPQALEAEESVPARLVLVRERSQRAAPRQRTPPKPKKQAPSDTKDPRNAPERTPSPADAEPKEEEKAEQPQGADEPKEEVEEATLARPEPAEPVVAPASGSHQSADTLECELVEVPDFSPSTSVAESGEEGPSAGRSAGVGESWVQVELPEDGYSRIVREAEERLQAREQRQQQSLASPPLYAAGITAHSRARPADSQAQAVERVEPPPEQVQAALARAEALSGELQRVLGSDGNAAEWARCDGPDGSEFDAASSSSDPGPRRPKRGPCSERSRSDGASPRGRTEPPGAGSRRGQEHRAGGGGARKRRRGRR